MLKHLLLAASLASLAFAPSANAQAPAPTRPAAFPALSFLLGTWSAATTPKGSAAAQALGTYTFRYDLAGTVIIRTGSLDSCTGPTAFDCQHDDSLTIFHDMGDPASHAVYFDNEGHTIHYDLSTPDANTVIFLSNTPGPKFRLVYHLEGTIMSGKFQFAPPGSDTFTSYLEWSGTRK